MSQRLPVRVMQRSIFNGHGLINRGMKLAGDIAALGLYTNAKHWAVVVGEGNCGWRFECKRGTISTRCNVVPAWTDTEGFKPQWLELGGETTMSYNQIEGIGNQIIQKNPIYGAFGSDCQMFVIRLLIEIIDSPTRWLFTEALKRGSFLGLYYVPCRFYQAAGKAVCAAVNEHRSHCPCCD